jgi:hypothetical protein
MFELELINLLNEYKNSTENYSKNKIKNSIKKLISENRNDLIIFKKKPEIEEWAKQIIEECENEIKEVNSQSNEQNDDMRIIKSAYEKWLSEYKANQNQVNENCSKIMDQLINFYIIARFDVLESILRIEDGEEYEKFKGHLKNKLRSYFANKIGIYTQKYEFTNLSFLQKVRKKAQLKQLIENLKQYNFNPSKIEEVLQ